MQKFNLKSYKHLEDFMSDENMVMSAQIISLGDDIYHDHDFYEISYMLNGEISHIVNERQMDLVSCDMVFFRPKDKHIFLRKNNTAKHRDILFQKDFFTSVINFLGEDFAAVYNSPVLPIKINVPAEKLEEIENLIEDYYLLQHENAKEKLLVAKFTLIKLFEFLKNHTEIKRDQSNQYPSWLNDLLQQMNMRQLYKEGLPSIVSLFNYNKSYMCNVFKKYIGMTMTEYLNDLRLQYAASQIKLTNGSILSISQEAGFSSISYFNKLFKKKYHCTPKKYKSSSKSTKK